MKHSLIDLWAADHGLQLDTRGARRQVALTVDRVRLHLRELQTGQILAHARVADIPENERARDEALTRALSVATARMRGSAAILAADEAGATLSLQLLVAAQSDVAALDRAVEHLVNEVDTWRAVL